MKLKKAQGISLNVIVIAAIALIVLLVIVFIFTGRIKVFGSTISSCTSQNGVCETPDLGTNCFDTDKDPPVYQKQEGCTCKAGSTEKTNTDCEKQQQICCIAVM